MILSTAVLIKGLYLVTNRVASWLGVGYFFRKAYREKRPIFYVWAVLLSVSMLAVLYGGYRLIAYLVQHQA